MKRSVKNVIHRSREKYTGRDFAHQSAAARISRALKEKK
jgi:hypothetical protein